MYLSNAVSDVLLFFFVVGFFVGVFFLHFYLSILKQLNE